MLENYIKIKNNKIIYLYLVTLKNKNDSQENR